MSGGDGFDVSPVELRPDRSILEWVIENTRIEPSAKQMNCSKRREQKEFNIGCPICTSIHFCLTLH